MMWKRQYATATLLSRLLTRFSGLRLNLVYFKAIFFTQKFLTMPITSPVMINMHLCHCHMQHTGLLFVGFIAIAHRVVGDSWTSCYVKNDVYCELDIVPLYHWHLNFACMQKSRQTLCFLVRVIANVLL